MKHCYFMSAIMQNNINFYKILFCILIQPNYVIEELASLEDSLVSRGSHLGLDQSPKKLLIWCGQIVLLPHLYAILPQHRHRLREREDQPETPQHMSVLAAQPCFSSTPVVYMSALLPCLSADNSDTNKPLHPRITVSIHYFITLARSHVTTAA